MVKKIWVILICLCLTGCSEPVYETVADIPAVSASAPCQQIVLNLPEDAAAHTAGDAGTGKIYECEGYTVMVQTLEAGDLDKTLQTLTGYCREQLQVIESVKDGCDRYDAVFTAAGEGSLLVGRVCILDDGAYHYAVSTLAPEANAGELRTVWEDLFGTFRIVDGDFDLNTGS